MYETTYHLSEIAVQRLLLPSSCPSPYYMLILLLSMNNVYETNTDVPNWERNAVED